MTFNEWFEKTKTQEPYCWQGITYEDIWEASQKAEREACAKLCEDNCAGYDYAQAEFCLTEFPKECGGRHDGMTYAKAIRERGEQK